MKQLFARALACGALALSLPALAAPPAADKKKPAAPQAPAGALALVDGVAITEKQVEERAASDLAQIRAREYEVRERTLQALIDDQLIARAAAARSLSASEYLRVEIDSKVQPVTEEEKKAFFEANKARIGNRTEAEVMPQIEEYLRRGRSDERRSALLRELHAAAKVQVLLDPPRKEVAATGPAKGPADAPVTIVEFSDFQCPFCSRVLDTMKQVEERYKGQVRVVFRHFPLNIHPNAPKAAEAGACANEQGKFWELHDKMFANQGGLAVEGLKRMAGEAGVQAEKFNECLDSGRHAETWRKDMEEGTAAGVTGTPAFFVNGRFINGAQPLDTFSRLIDDELQRKGLPVPAEPKPAAEATK